MPGDLLIRGLFVSLLFTTYLVGLRAEAFMTQQNYVRECEASRIHIPDSFNCDAGEELPVYQTSCDAQGNAQNIIQLKRETYGEAAFFGKCDHPALVQKDNPFTGCMPGARIQLTPKHQNGSFCAVVCRRTNNYTKPSFFQDVSMICHQPSNGATCFFNSKVDERSQFNPNIAHDGRSLVKPGAPKDSTWMTPQEVGAVNCVRCHDNEPFVVTPNLYDFGKTLKALKLKREKYLIVGSGLPFSAPSWKNRYHLEQKNLCTSCHRIGAGDFGGCGYLRDAAVGQYKTGGNTCIAEKAWMPPPGHEGEDFLLAVDELKRCCNDVSNGVLKSDAQCNWQLIDKKN